MLKAVAPGMPQIIPTAKLKTRVQIRKSKKKIKNTKKMIQLKLNCLPGSIVSYCKQNFKIRSTCCTSYIVYLNKISSRHPYKILKKNSFTGALYCWHVHCISVSQFLLKNDRTSGSIHI